MSPPAQYTPGGQVEHCDGCVRPGWWPMVPFGQGVGAALPVPHHDRSGHSTGVLVFPGQKYPLGHAKQLLDA